MPLFWSGRGYLVPLIFLGVLLVTSILTDAVMGEGYYEANRDPLLLGATLASVWIWNVGRRLNSGEPQRLLKPGTMEEVWIQPESHTFLAVPIQWWGPVIFALMLYGYFFEPPPTPD